MAKHDRIPCLDNFRSIAVLLVIACHLDGLGWIPRIPGLRAVTAFGTAGVDLFFVLSGFLIGGIILRELETTGALTVVRFWSRRWLRTLPAYYATFAFVFIADTLLHRPFPRAATYLVFLQNYASPLERFSWSWSLCVEEHFYLALPIIITTLLQMRITMQPRRMLRGIAIVGLAISLTSRAIVAHTVDLTNAGWGVYMANIYGPTHCRLDGLAAGIFLVTLDLRRTSYAIAWFYGGLAATVACIVINTTSHIWYVLNGYFPLALAFGAMMYGALKSRIRDMAFPGARFTAEISYGLYLVHPVVINALLPTLRWPRPFGLFLACTATTVTAIVLRHTIELPALRWRDRFASAAKPGAVQ